MPPLLLVLIHVADEQRVRLEAEAIALGLHMPLAGDAVLTPL